MLDVVGDNGVLSSMLLDMPRLEHRIGYLWLCIPAPWRTYLRQPTPGGVTQPGVVAMLMNRLGWRVKISVAADGGRKVEAVLRMELEWRVKQIMPLLCGEIVEARHARWGQYLEDAQLPLGGGLVFASVQEGITWLSDTVFPLAWKVRWENLRKETLWRLSVQGVPNAGGHDICRGGVCPCGWRCAGQGAEGARQERSHYFWHCSVAKAVVAEIQACLPADVPVACAHVWLVRPPSAAVDMCVWIVVCLAALSAMDTGRRFMWKLHLTAPALRQQTLLEAWGMQDAAPSSTVCAGRVAVAQFWQLMQDFVGLHKWPCKWPAGQKLPVGHAFICPDPIPAPRGTISAICLNRPAP
jgi:hypothetical protein